MQTSPDPTLPHTGYATAVAEALSGSPQAPTLARVGVQPFSEGEERLLIRMIRRQHAVLIWQPQLGWRRATTQGQFEDPETAPRLTTALVPSPVDVAAAWQAWEKGRTQPWPCEETPPASGALPGRLVSAVSGGELTQQAAERLAVYITETYPYEHLWHQQVRCHRDTGRPVSGTLLPSTGERYHLDTPSMGELWLSEHQVAAIEAA